MKKCLDLWFTLSPNPCESLKLFDLTPLRIFCHNLERGRKVDFISFGFERVFSLYHVAKEREKFLILNKNHILYEITK